jgi:hypothetical protein
MAGMLAVRVTPPPYYSEGVDPQREVGRACRVLAVREGGTVGCHGNAFSSQSRAFAPDLTDPATLGCLCALAGVWTDDAEALVAALEAALASTPRAAPAPRAMGNLGAAIAAAARAHGVELGSTTPPSPPPAAAARPS